MFVSQLMRQIHLVKTLVKIYGKVQIIISSSVADSIFSLDLIVNFEKTFAKLQIMLSHIYF